MPTVEYGLLKITIIDLDSKHQPTLSNRQICVSDLMAPFNQEKWALVEGDNWTDAVTELWGELMSMGIKDSGKDGE